MTKPSCSADHSTRQTRRQKLLTKYTSSEDESVLLGKFSARKLKMEKRTLEYKYRKRHKKLLEAICASLSHIEQKLQEQTGQQSDKECK